MSRGAWVLGVILTAAASAATAQETQGITAEALTYGESVNGFPNWAERVMHQWMNRARVDPQTDLQCGAACPEKPCYSPQPPLTWSQQANRAARFHAAEIIKQQYFAHDSKCAVVQNIDALYPVGCDGSASCACVGGAATCAPGACTAWTARVAMFGAGPFGEIIASSPEPVGALTIWMNEFSQSSNCAYNSANGHRWLILTTQGAVGIGAFGVAVADFVGSATSYKIPSGAHYPQQAASVELWANWFDAAAPRSAHAVVDGSCVSLTLKRGTAKNGAWMATASGVGAGCHRYYFSFVDASGARITYPATGSLGIGPDAQCTDWNATRLQASCSSSAPPPSSARHRAARH